MSGDPMTMAIIANTAFQVAGTYSEIQDAKFQAQVQKNQYENEMKMAELKAIQEENNRRELAEDEIDANRAYWASTGFLDDSRNLIGANESVTKKMKSDIQDIRVNSYALQNKYELMKLSTASAAKNKVFGGYASIGSSMATGYSNYELYTISDTYKDKQKKKDSA